MLHSHYGHKAPTVAKILHKEGEYLSRRGITKFIDRYKSRGTELRKPGSGKWAIVTDEIKKLVDAKMTDDDETTAAQLHRYLIEQGKYLKCTYDHSLVLIHDISY